MQAMTIACISELCPHHEADRWHPASATSCVPIFRWATGFTWHRRIEVGQGMGDFANLLVDQVRNVNTMQNNASDQVHSLLTGGDVNEAEVLTSVQKADLAFRMLLQVRNKLIEAYREVQQIQI